MHSINSKSIIGTQESVYWDSPLGKLKKISSVRNMIIPLQKGFYRNSKARLPVGVNDLPALFAFKERIVAGMPFTNSTAVATPFTCVMIGINNIERDLFVEASAFEQLPEGIKRDSHNFFVEFFAFGAEPLKIFNSNIGVESQSHFGDASGDFSEPVFNEVVFFVFEPFKVLSCSTVSFVGKGLQFFFSFKNLFSLNPDVFSEIGLFENPAFWGENRNSKAFAVDIHSENVFSFREFGFFFGEVGNNLPITSQAICLTLPTAFNERTVSLQVPILLDWNRQTLSWIQSESYKEAGFSIEGFAVSGNIELNSDLLNGCSLAPNNTSYNATDNLRAKRGVFLAC